MPQKSLKVIVIFFSLTEPPLPDPTQLPETRPNWTETGRNGQMFRQGVGGKGLATNKPQKQPKKRSPGMRPPSPKRGIRKRVQKRGLNLWDSKDLFANPLCLPTP